jgi:hypothetical protein
MSRSALVARDPRTYRRFALVLALGWDHTSDPVELARYLGNLTVNIARAWLRRYGSPLPMRRVEWSIDTVDDPSQLGGL